MRKITKISNRIIRKFDPCYDPSELGSKESEYLPIVEAVEKYRAKCKNKSDVIWLLCRKEFMTDKDMRLFAVWCAREALKLDNPDERSINACNVAERFANGKADCDELNAAWNAALNAAVAVAGDAYRDAYCAALGDAAWAAAWDADADEAAAGDAAGDAYRDAYRAAYWAAYWDAAWASVRAAAWAAAWDAAGDAQIDKLLTYFK